MDYYFFYIFQRSTFNLEKTKAFVKENFGSPDTSNRIYLLWNCFSNYVYHKDMYITLKGTGKVIFASVLRILLIYKFLNFAAVFTKTIKLSKVFIQRLEKDE